MIVIDQNKRIGNGINSIISRINKEGIELNQDTIDEDIERLKDMRSKASGKYSIRKIDEIIQYLEKGAKNCKKITWGVKDDIIESMPFELLEFENYGIDMMKYVKRDNGVIVKLDYVEMVSIIAIDIMYRDLFESFESMEDKLKDVPIIGIAPASDILKYFEGDDMIDISRTYKIGSSPYKVAGRDTIMRDYFGVKEIKSEYYREVVKYSCLYAMSLIIQNIFKSQAVKKMKIGLCSIRSGYIQLKVDKRLGDKDIHNIPGICENVSVRAFGRYFLVKPKISIY